MNLVEAVRARGSDASDTRDAAHEAFHALAAGVNGPWRRERVHEALCGVLSGPELWLHELRARAVERVACERRGEDPGEMTQWVSLSCMEAMKRGLPYSAPDLALRMVERMLTEDETLQAVERVLALMEDA